MSCHYSWCRFVLLLNSTKNGCLVWTPRCSALSFQRWKTMTSRAKMVRKIFRHNCCMLEYICFKITRTVCGVTMAVTVPMEDIFCNIQTTVSTSTLSVWYLFIIANCVVYSEQHLYWHAYHLEWMIIKWSCYLCIHCYR